MNNVLTSLLGTQALDQENNSFMVVALDTEAQYVFLVDNKGQSYIYDFDDLIFPELGLLVKPAPLRAVENKEDTKKGWL